MLNFTNWNGATIGILYLTETYIYPPPLPEVRDSWEGKFVISLEFFSFCLQLQLWSLLLKNIDRLHTCMHMTAQGIEIAIKYMVKFATG